jgi:NNP family nitrate/nitrite transporter-like MFS transporter
MLGVMRVMQIRWTRTWAEKGGRARVTTSQHAPATTANARKTARS